MRATLIYNPMAGRFPSLPLVERAANLLQTNGWEIEIVRTAESEDITRVAEKAAAQKKEAIFVAGGDGSVHKAAAGLMGSQTALGVLPAGTANVWAQELGLPGLSWTNWSALETSVKKLINGSVRTMDLGRCQGKPFLLWAGIGFDAFVVHHLEPRSRLQKQFALPQYAANAAWYARTWSGMDLEIRVDDQDISGMFILALVTNVHLYAGGLAEVAPSARIDDQQMDLWLFSGDTLAETLQHVWAVVTGNLSKSQQVASYRCRTLQIRSQQELYLQVDGEPLTPATTVQIDIQPQSLRVIVPETLPRPLFSEKEI